MSSHSVQPLAPTNTFTLLILIVTTTFYGAKEDITIQVDPEQPINKDSHCFVLDNWSPQ